MPCLYILAGPNGSGKTTYYRTAVSLGYISSGLPFLNVDVICQEHFGAHTDEHIAKAEAVYRVRVSALMEAEQDETNLARDFDYSWLWQMAARGYRLVLFFICNDDVSLNIARVRSRVAEGGHDVPEGIVVKRYNASLSYLTGRLHRFEEAHLIDATGDRPVLAATACSGRATQHLMPYPGWVVKVLSTASRLPIPA